MKILFYSILFAGTFSTLVNAQSRAPEVFTHNFKTQLTEGYTLPGNDSLNDVGVRFFFSEEYEKYDFFTVELHLTYIPSGGDWLIAFKKYVPSSNAYKVKNTGRDSVDLWILNPNGKDGDLELNAGKPVVGGIYENLATGSKNYNDFSIIVKGYLKTGTQNIKHDEYGNAIKVDDYDDGTILAKSIIFKTRVKGKLKLGRK